MAGQQTIVAADLITEHQHYSGLVHTEGRRLADVLTDHGLTVLEMNQVTLTTVGTRPSEFKLEKMLIKKDHLLMAIPKGAYEAPINRSNRYQKKGPYDATIVLPGHILHCVVHMPPRMTPWAVADRPDDLPTFFGVTNVTVHSSFHTLVPDHCDTAIIRREAIESIEMPGVKLPNRKSVPPLETEDILQAIRELRGAT